MRYLAVWRMQLAKYLLKQTTLNVGEVAQRVGYESDVAFNRAFRRMWANRLPPGVLRSISVRTT